MYLTGFADEAAAGIAEQIRATKTLGWSAIESRNVDGVNLHDLSDEAFDRVAEALAEAGITVNCFGSAIANWGKSVLDPFEITLAEVRRTITRMRRLGTQLIRIMSYAVFPNREPDDQLEAERFRRMRLIHAMFADAGLTPVHENCMNYGGMSWQHTLRLLDAVPGLRLVFDTGNPVFTDDRSKPKPYPKQSAWEFYTHVKEHVAYIHIKDGIWESVTGQIIYTYPGEGQGDVRRILIDLLASGYKGGISIEPHMTMVHHHGGGAASEDQRFENYITYGRRLEQLLAEIRSSSC